MSVSQEGKIIPGGEPEGAGAAPTSRLSRRHLLMGAGLLAVSGLAFARTPQRRYPDLTDEQFNSMFPTAFGDWRVLPVSELVMPPESELANKVYQHILTRTYLDKQGVAVMFLAAYNSIQLNNVQLHRPEICYHASGFTIDDSRPYDLRVLPDDVVPARLVEATRGSRTENVLYWTRIGEEFPQTWTGQRISMTKANLEGFMADGLLLRMSVIDPDANDAVAKMNRFITDMVRHGGAPMRRMLLGKA